MNTAEVAIIFIIGSLTLLVFVLFVVLILFEYRKRQVRHITEKLELKHRYQNEVLQTQLEVQEQSFKYVSEELHDNIAQMLSLVKIKLYKTAGKTEDENIKAGLETSTDLLSKTMDDLRNLSHTLSGGLVSKLPLPESLEKELNYVRNANEMDAALSLEGEEYDLPGEKKLLIFRIVQEAIGNAIKHGKAKRININLAYAPTQLTLTIADDGKGFDTKLLNDSKGLGLQNMQVRAKLLGSMDVASSENGTTITLKIDTDE
ncbi:MAG: ATP-binding protein [Chitinophagales bacterium]|nr:ATP-binding protein [Chitinophagaceae bacterium]MCB9065204.1 ATP-binding protein [Chitinophagales bacterium]